MALRGRRGRPSSPASRRWRRRRLRRSAGVSSAKPSPCIGDSAFLRGNKTSLRLLDGVEVDSYTGAVPKIRAKEPGRGFSLEGRDVSPATSASTRQPSFLHHSCVTELDRATVLEDTIREVRYVWFIKFGVRIVGRYLYATAIAEVCSFAGTRHHVR